MDRYEFDFASIVILIILLLFFFKKRRSDNIRTKAFTNLIILTFVTVLLSILRIYCIKNVNPKYVNFFSVVNSIFFMLHLLASLFVLIYVSKIFIKDNKNNYLMMGLFSIPCIIYFILILFNFKYEFIFYSNTKNPYNAGDFQNIIFYFSAFYYLVSIGIVSLGKISIASNDRLKMLGILFVYLCGSVFQFAYPGQMLVSFFSSIALLLLYFLFQDPKDDLDSVSGLFNKQAFSQKIKVLKEKNKRHQILVIAVNSFSKINDNFGVEIGNVVLKKIAFNISNISSSKNIYRYGGDKFIIIFPDNTMNQVINDLMDFFNKPLSISDIEVPVSLRYVVINSDDFSSTNHLIKIIDYSLKEAKKDFKNSVFEVDKEVLLEIEKYIAIEVEIDRQIDNNTFELYFQPIYDSKTKSYSSAEALARLNVPGYGYISPDLFISLAEKNDQIIELGLIIIEEVFKFITSNDMSKLNIKKININLSIVQCMQKTLAREIISLARWYKIDPRMINFEITETAQISTRDILLANMNELIKYGFEFSLDDYGTGYSTLEFIMLLPFSTIKLDQNFVKESINNNDLNTVLEYTTVMLNKLKKNIVAEGVENQEIFNLMLSNNIRYIQGFYHSKPLPKDEFLTFIESKNIIQ